MSTEALVELLRGLLRAPLDLFWAGVAWMMDELHGETPLVMSGVILGALATAGGLARLLQHRINRRLKEDPDRSHSLLQLAWLEARHAFALLPLQPFWLLFLALRALWRLLVRFGRWLGRLVTRRPAPKKSPKESTEELPDDPILVATLGPSCLLAGLFTVGLYILSRLAEPLLAERLDLSHGFSAWEFLMLGLRPELAWYLPLQRFPYFATLLATVLWLAVWSLVASAIRLVHHDPLGRNLHESRADAEIPPVWPRWFATRSAHEPAKAYRQWARWPVLVSIPLFAWAWLSLAAEPYRLLPSELAVGAVLWLSWGLHVDLLRGLRRDPPPTEADEATPDVPRNGWEEILQYLEATHQLRRPEPFELNPALSLAGAPPDRQTTRILSPLVEELLARAVHQSSPSPPNTAHRGPRPSSSACSTKSSPPSPSRGTSTRSPRSTWIGWSSGRRRLKPCRTGAD